MDFVLSATPFAAIMFAAMMIALEAGRRAGKRALVKDPNVMSGLSTLDSTVFALFGLLIAFTFSGAPDRLDARRQLIAQEANAIGTAYLRLDLLPVEAQPALRDKFREYLSSRIETYRVYPDVAAAEQGFAKSDGLQTKIWVQAVAATKLPGSHPDAARLLLPAVNAMIDITTTRRMAAKIHPPLVIFLLLFILAVICSVLAGYAMATSQRRSWLHVMAFTITAVLSVYVILEIEYPRMGFIRHDIYDQTLIDVGKIMR